MKKIEKKMDEFVKQFKDRPLEELCSYTDKDNQENDCMKLYCIGTCLLNNLKLDEAEIVCKRAYDIFVKNDKKYDRFSKKDIKSLEYQLLCGVGFSLIEKGKVKEASEYIDQAIEIFPEDAFSQIIKLRGYLHSSNMEEYYKAIELMTEIGDIEMDKEYQEFYKISCETILNHFAEIYSRPKNGFAM